MPSTIIASWFVADAESERTDYPQVGGASHTLAFQSVYWRCLVAFYFSSIKVNPGRRHLLYTNAQPPTIEGIPIAELLQNLGVELVHVPITHRLPPGSVNSWGNQFYIFDIIKHAAKAFANDRILVFDSDCVFLRSIDQMETAIDTYGALTYTLYIDQDDNYVVNGLSRADLAKLAFQVFGTNVDAIPYAGGEVFASTGAECQRMIPWITRLWTSSVEHHNGSSPREEAQALSLVYQVMGYENATANPFIRRIWTSLRLNNTRSSDLQLAIWHLPAEKKNGFVRLFQDCIDLGSTFHRLSGQEQLLSYYSNVMGVPKRGLIKLSRDLTGKILEHVHARFETVRR